MALNDHSKLKGPGITLTGSSATPSEEQLQSILDSMLISWESRQPEIQMDMAVHPNQLITVFGLAANAHRLGRAALTLFRAGHRNEALPTVRAIYEHALTVQWLALHATGTNAFINEYGRNRINIAKTLRDTGKPEMEQVADFMDRDVWEKIPTDSDRQAKYLQQLCDDLEPAGQEAYFYYRLMSSLSHPTGKVVDEYLTDNPVTLHLEPKNETLGSSWIFFACLGILLCSGAVDLLEKGNPRRVELERIAQILGSPYLFRLSAKYYERTGSSVQD